MNKKDSTKLNIISAIDDEIIEKQSIRRYELLTKVRTKHPNKKTIIGFVSAAACLCIIVGVVLFALLGGDPSVSKQVPIYKGMTVSNDAPVSEDSAYFDFEAAELEFLSAPLYEEDRVVFIDENVNSKDNGNHFGNDKGDDKNNDSTAPEVFGGTYYALKNEDIYIHVHLSNPDEFEILSFTLNGKKYSSNMFEYGSDLERLILKYNVGDVDGLQEYTIDAIKYIDGDKIKDVRMDGDRTVKVYVNDDTQMLNFGAELVGFELLINPTWKSDFEGAKIITSLSLWKGEEKLRDLDTNTTIIDGLPSGERLILKATYNDGGVEKTAQYIFDTRKQSEGLTVTNGVVTGIGTCTDTVLYIDMPIANYAFEGNKHIDTVFFGNNATSIGANAFHGCPITKISFCKGATEIGESSFANCENLTSVNLPEGLTSIGTLAFLGCNSLTTVNLPEGLTNIGTSAFSSCDSLTTVNLPESLKSIGGSAFYMCLSLKEIVIPKNVEFLGEHAFALCNSLTEVRIESTIIKMDPSFGTHFYNPEYEDYRPLPVGTAFTECTLLSNIYFNGTIEQWNTATSELLFWMDVSANPTVHCLDGEVMLKNQNDYYDNH